MAFVDTIFEELEREGKSTARILERVPPEKHDWSPHVKSMTLGELAWHIANLPKSVGGFLREGVFAPRRGQKPEVPAEPGAIAARYRQNLADLREQLTAMQDAEFRESIDMKRGDQTVAQFSKAALIRVVLLNHSYHHRGQLTVYLRLLDVPVPAMYGVSADEDPFKQ